MNNSFTFNYPLKRKVVRDLKIVTETVGELQVEAIGYVDKEASHLDLFDKYSVDIEFIRWKGQDIKQVLEALNVDDEIVEAAIRYFASLQKSI